mgnify:CR=1 FL=1
MRADLTSARLAGDEPSPFRRTRPWYVGLLSRFVIGQLQRFGISTNSRLIDRKRLAALQRGNYSEQVCHSAIAVGGYSAQTKRCTRSKLPPTGLEAGAEAAALRGTHFRDGMASPGSPEMRARESRAALERVCDAAFNVGEDLPRARWHASHGCSPPQRGAAAAVRCRCTVARSAGL